MKKALATVWLALFLVSCAAPASPSAIPTQADIAVDWAALHLVGKLFFIHFQEGGNQLVRLDLATGKSTVVFQAPERSVLSGAAVSPDGMQIALAYSPPPPKGETFIFPTIFLLPASGSGSPKALIPGLGSNDSYLNATWMPDGKTLYATHYHRGTGGDNPNRNLIEKISPDGKVAPILDHATWPELSPDGKKLAYLTIDPQTSLNHLAIADSDGSHSQEMLPGAPFPTVDAHRFTPDGHSILFSAANPPKSFQQSPLEKLLGVEIVSAHSLPSDLYLIPVTGGDYSRVTSLLQTGIYPAVSPDGKMLAFISQGGIYVGGIDGSGLKQISNQIVIGTLDWIP